MVHRLSHQWFFWAFLTNTKQDQAPPSEVQLSRVKFSPTALNFGYDVFTFFGTPCRFHVVQVASLGRYAENQNGNLRWHLP